MKTHRGKLVRDRIPELLAERGITDEVRIADRLELPTLLPAKLEEERAEYLAATDDDPDRKLPVCLRWLSSVGYSMLGSSSSRPGRTSSTWVRSPEPA